MGMPFLMERGDSDVSDLYYYDDAYNYDYSYQHYETERTEPLETTTQSTTTSSTTTTTTTKTTTTTTRSTTIKTMPITTTNNQNFPMLPTLGFDGFTNDFGMPELGLTSLFDLDQSREITKNSFKPTESMRQEEPVKEVPQSIEIQKPDTTRKTFSISRPRVTPKKEPEAPSPSKKSFAISKPK